MLDWICPDSILWSKITRPLLFDNMEVFLLGRCFSMPNFLCHFIFRQDLNFELVALAVICWKISNSGWFDCGFRCRSQLLMNSLVCNLPILYRRNITTRSTLAPALLNHLCRSVPPHPFPLFLANTLARLLAVAKCGSQSLISSMYSPIYLSD